MNGLEQAFYIIGIITMSLILLILIAIAMAVFVIRNKIVHVHNALEEKFAAVAGIAKAAKAAKDAVTKKR